MSFESKLSATVRACVALVLLALAAPVMLVLWTWEKR
jgi:hypothetical protein